MSVIESPALTRTERRKQQTIERIRDACAALFLERSYANLTIQAITERADVGYGTFYLHFKDKDDVVWQVLLDWGNAYEQVISEQLAQIEFPRREYLSWVALFDYVDKVRDQFRSVFGREGSAVLAQRYQDYIAHLHERNISESRYFVTLDLPTEFLAQFMAGALMRLLVWWVETPNAYSADDMAGMLFETMYRMPAPRKGMNT